MSYIRSVSYRFILVHLSVPALRDGTRFHFAAKTFESICVPVQGVSPGLAKDLAARADVDAATSPAQLHQAAWHALHSAWTTWLLAVQTGAPVRFSPVIVLVQNEQHC